MTHIPLGQIFNYLWLLVNAKFYRLIFRFTKLLNGVQASSNPDEGRWVVTRDGVRQIRIYIYRNEAARGLSLRGGKSPVLINWHGQW
jgi:hypothetical protein